MVKNHLPSPTNIMRGKKMKKIFVVLVLLTLVTSFSAFGASTRWNALGGEHRFMIDTSNYTPYPGRITLFGNALFVMPMSSDDNGFCSGLLLNVKNMTLAFHYNLNSTGTGNLKSALGEFKLSEVQATELSDALKDLDSEDAGSEDWLAARSTAERLSQRQRLGSLDLKEFPDLFWAMKMDKISLGARLAIAMDSGNDATSLIYRSVGSDEAATGKTAKIGEEMTTKAMSIDFSAGASMYATPAGDLDLGLTFGMQNFSDDDPNSDRLLESTGGMDIAFNARLDKPLDKDKNYMLTPIASVNIGSRPTVVDTTEVSYMKGDLGVGIRKKVKEKGMVVAGALGNFGTTTTTPTKGDETVDTTLGATILGGVEFPVTKWLIVRGGANVKFSSITDEMIVTEVNEDYKGEGTKTPSPAVGTKKSTGVGYYYNTGIRMMYGGFIMDVLLDRNIFHRGPYILTGAGDAWGTSICLTYAF